ncbi:MAG TPA: BamA/TamA family outer membrane protein, partial [Sphingomonas sp.]|nr:BamA/TamA family outer membrane protein [Sphingomonas sp.]
TDHIEVLRRYRPGDLYDARKVDDLRQALVATSLFQSVAVEPQRTGRAGPDGTEEVDLLVTQNKGPARTLAGQVGYGTGEGFTLQGSWTHRNLFPPEGALIVSGIAGTQQQGLGVTFRRSNAGRRDRTVTAIASANRQDYDAFEAFTGTLSGRISYDSTPIWQKKWTYYYGFELVGTNEDVYDFTLLDRVRRTYFIGALPAYVGYDSSDDLLNPTKGFRVKLNVSPEASINRGTRPYARGMLEGTAYYPVTSSIVIAGRARVGAIGGIARDDLAPSRRYYAGGGGSVRGFGFQQLGPKTEEPNPKFDPNDPETKEPPTIFRPIGGRSFNEFAIEARYRFGNFGIVPFLDAGQVYDSTLPKGSDLRFGAGIGGRFYTNFGPLRVDVATPIARKPGESKIALYLSIGQAF